MWICKICNDKFNCRSDFLVHSGSANCSTVLTNDDSNIPVEKVVLTTTDIDNEVNICEDISTSSQMAITEDCDANDVGCSFTKAVAEPFSLENNSEYLPADEETSSDDEVDNMLLSSKCRNKRNIILDGMETFPEVTDRPRKQRCVLDKWSKNLRKEKRAKRKLVSSINKSIPKVTMKPACPPTAEINIADQPGTSNKIVEERSNTSNLNGTGGVTSDENDDVHAVFDDSLYDRDINSGSEYNPESSGTSSSKESDNETFTHITADSSFQQKTADQMFEQKREIVKRKVFELKEKTLKIRPRNPDRWKKRKAAIARERGK
ncbi:unnamed protein product [Diabrotica balteata]|uniref:Uncharacterized protein n=1 Tax=Diabrotica balteata TaxID=107213 RepID=A0A9N9T883_DIABA|nr:unnamed protein product [Diabrotica balteata]